MTEDNTRPQPAPPEGEPKYHKLFDQFRAAAPYWTERDAAALFGGEMYRLGLAARPKVEDAEVATLIEKLRHALGWSKTRDGLCQQAADLLERLAAKLAEREAELAKADAVVHYYVARDWPRYGYEPPILDIRSVIEPQTGALDRHRKRHAARQQQKASAETTEREE